MYSLTAIAAKGGLAFFEAAADAVGASDIARREPATPPADVRVAVPQENGLGPFADGSS
jgi:hypothetical protein